MFGHVVPMMHHRAAQMAEHKPEHALEHCLSCLRHAVKITRSHETESSSFTPFRRARLFFAMSQILP